MIVGITLLWPRDHSWTFGFPLIILIDILWTLWLSRSFLESWLFIIWPLRQISSFREDLFVLILWTCIIAHRTRLSHKLFEVVRLSWDIILSWKRSDLGNVNAFRLLLWFRVIIIVIAEI